MRSKIHKIRIILFCIFVSLVWTKYPVFAQVSGPQPSGNSQQLPPTPPTVSPASTKQPSNVTTTNRETGPSQLATDPKYSTIQQDTQDRNSLRTSDIPQRSIPDLQPTAPSPIEIEFQVRTPAIPGIALGQLTQFGYAFFTSNISTYAPIYDVPVESNYVLGPGDELRITIWGTIENTYSQTVDRYGRIYLPTIGPIRVWGLTFSEAEKLIREHLSHYYKGFQSSITMGQLRTIKVYVVGEVNNPGSYDISALSTLINALFASGGPSRIGSLRNIELKRNHRTVGYFDFYDFLLKGDKGRDFRMESGDVIFVPPIGSVAGIMGQVRRPAIYEIKDPIRVSGFIEMAGGQVPQSYLKRIQVIRIKPNAEREVVDIDLTDTKNGNQQNDIEIRNGDLVIVFPTDPLIYNTCTLEGTVKYPGEYEVKPGMRLSQLLTLDTLLPNAYLDKVEIVRFKEDLKADVIHINLKKIWEGDTAHDILLLPRDKIAVRSEYKPSETVTLSGEFKLPGTYTIERGERLGSVIKRAGEFTDLAFLEGAVFIRRSVAEREREKLDAFIQHYEESLLNEIKPPMLGSSPELAQNQQAEISQKRAMLRILASRVTLGRIVIHLDVLEKFKGSHDDIILENGDTLTIPLPPAEIITMGSVRNPSSIVYRNDENIQYYINRCGGFSVSANKKEIYILKVDGSAIVGFLKLRTLDPGDTIVVPPKYRKFRDLSWISQIATIAGQTALTFGALSVLANN